MNLSVVIPTRNRQAILAGCLEYLTRQSMGSMAFEVIVVADRCTDQTTDVAQQFFGSGKLRGQVIPSHGAGAGAARNLGFRQAAGDLILFLDDDVYAAPDLLERHIQFHKENPGDPLALLGFVTWHPDVQPTPFMEWMEQGPLFAFHSLSDGQEAHWKFFYTCNVSLKRQLLLKTGGFDEDFKQSGLEDSEFGFRLHSAGMRLFYRRSAWGYHFQFLTLQLAARRNYHTRVNRVLFNSKPVSAALEAEQREPRWIAYADMAGMALLLPLEIAFFLPLVNSRVRLPHFIYRHLVRTWTWGLMLKTALTGN